MSAESVPASIQPALASSQDVRAQVEQAHTVWTRYRHSGQDQVPPVAVVDFVCEDDVRRAEHESRNIFIGPKTIVTPSARDFANHHDVLVSAGLSPASKRPAPEKASSE
jgi:hypothetical protein